MSNRYYDAGPTASGRKVFLATTVYEKPDASYVFSIARSREALTAAGIQSAYYLLQGNCHVDDARNTVVRDFLVSDCTELVFLDADVSWEPSHLVELCKTDRDLCGGVYPFRREGEASMPVRMIEGVDVDADGLLEVEGLPTGFMKIKRHVLETMAATAKHFVKDEGKPFPVIFERDYYGGGRRGGDIHFCMLWREMGGKVHALPELRLSHAGGQVITDSLGACVRRLKGTTLRWFADRVRAKEDNHSVHVEAVRAAGNRFGAPASGLHVAVGLARSSDGPVLEIGSGLSTIALAATGAKVWCIEHDERFAADVERMAAEAGVSDNIVLVTADLRDGWYVLADVLDKFPAEFGLAFVDGPPRTLGDRMRFFDVFGDRCKVILSDDANQPSYAAKLAAWAASRNRGFKVEDRAAVILPKG